MTVKPGKTFGLQVGFFYSHHVEPRVKLYAPKELLCNRCTSTQCHTVPQLSPCSLPKIILKTNRQARHEDHQHVDERNSDVEHGQTRGQIHIWQDQRKECQQADEDKFVVKHGKPVAEANSIRFFWNACCGRRPTRTVNKSSMSLIPSASDSPGIPTAQSRNLGLIAKCRETCTERFKHDAAMSSQVRQPGVNPSSCSEGPVRCATRTINSIVVFLKKSRAFSF